MTGHWPDALAKPSACLSQMERQDGNACSSTAVVAMNAREDVPFSSDTRSVDALMLV